MNKLDIIKIPDAKNTSNKVCNKTTYIAGVGILGTIVTAVFGYVVYKLLIEKTDFIIPKDDDELSAKRQESRGLLSSLIVALTFGGLNVAINSTCKVSLPTSTALLNLFLGSTIGFLMDNAMGTNDNLEVFQSVGYTEGIKSMFSTLGTGKYLRYVITVLMDTFISLLLLEPSYNWLITVPFFKCNDFTKSVANGLLASVIGVVTFNAYTNQTRFSWAYPDMSLGEPLLPTSAILLINIVLAILFLKTKTGNGEGIDNPNVKLGLLYGILILTSILYMTDMDTPSFKKKILEQPKKVLSKIDETIKHSDIKGKLVFSGIVILCLFGTFATSKLTSLKKWMIPAGMSFVFILFAFTNGFGTIADLFKKTDENSKKNNNKNNNKNLQ
jgi:hypothetical protein